MLVNIPIDSNALVDLIANSYENDADMVDFITALCHSVDYGRRERKITAEVVKQLTETMEG